MLDGVSENSNGYKNCYQPTNPSKSIYPYCDKIFTNKGFDSVNRCKTDMCRLCCVNYDFTSKSKISKNNLQQCYKGCLR